MVTEVTELYGAIFKADKKQIFPWGSAYTHHWGCAKLWGGGGDRALYTWQQVLVKGGLLIFRVSRNPSSWSFKLGNADGISENQIIC